MFGRLLALVGIIVIGVGVFGIFRASQSFMGTNLGNTMQLATDAKAREAQLCKTGEKLQEDKGPSEYNASQGTYGSSVTMYCVNNDGIKRDVTEQFGNSMVSQVGGIFENMLPNLLGSVIYVVLIPVGVVLTIIGLIFSRRRSGTVSFGVPVVSSTGFTSYTTQNSGGRVDLNQVIQQARDMKATATGSGDLTTRLKQLEDARNAGLISQTEYDRTRQQILDTLK
ncbi:MAG: hypothetical protein H0X30_20670 [Anaerolineae bacterium]|nr:hypothetical protein [Anaerolineae bacterium]